MSLRLRVEALEACRTQNDPEKSRLPDDIMDKIILRVFHLADETAHPLHEPAKGFVEAFVAAESDPVAINKALKVLCDELRRRRDECAT